MRPVHRRYHAAFARTDQCGARVAPGRIFGLALIVAVACGCAGKAPAAPVQPARLARLVITKTGVTVAVTRAEAHGWRVSTPCGHTATIVHGTPITVVDVMLDPGHGGVEAGAVSHDLREADINLDVARRVQRDLEKGGITVALTRTGNYRLPIPTRAAIVNAIRPKLFVSIHHNSGDAAPHNGPGTEVYYQHGSPAARRLGGLVWQHIVGSISKYTANWVGASDAGAIYRLDQHQADYYGVLRRTHGTPSVLAEVSYVSEPTEAALLATAGFRAAEARGIADGIVRYLHSKDLGSGFHTPIQRGYADNGGGGGTFIGCRDPALQ